MRNPCVFVVYFQVSFAQTQKDHDAAGIRRPGYIPRIAERISYIDGCPEGA